MNDDSDSVYKMYNAFPSVTGRLVLIVFVILTSIVLMNLMISLAVSDAQLLANEVRASIVTPESYAFFSRISYFLFVITTGSIRQVIKPSAIHC